MSRTARTGFQVSISKGERAIVSAAENATGQTRKGLMMSLYREKLISLGINPKEIENQKGNDDDFI